MQTLILATTNIDMISKLPELAQHNILNFLEEYEVRRAAVLSKAWRSIVESRPVIYFNQALMEQNSKNAKETDLMSHISTNFIDESLRNKLYVERFSLVLDRYDDHRSHWDKNMDAWIEYLVKVGVKAVTLVTGRRDYSHCPLYTLPSALLRSKTLTKLWLEPCFEVDNICVDLPNLLELTLVRSGKNEDNVFRVFISGCPSLLRLTLKLSNFDQEMFEEFISGTPNLEVLDMKVGFCRVLSICVSGLARLRVLKLTGAGFARVEIVAPKLRVVNIMGWDVTEIDLLACNSTLKVLNLNSCLKLTEETLRSILYKFLELEELVLDGLYVKSIEIMNKKIRKLEITWCRYLENVEIDAPNLRVFTSKCNNTPFSPMNLTSSLEKFELRLPIVSSEFHNKFPSWLQSFKELFLNMRRFKDVKLIIRRREIVIVCEDLDENFMKIICDMNVNEKEHWEYVCIGKHECMLKELFRRHYSNIAYVYWVSRDLRSYEKILEVLKDKTLKENEEPKPKRYKYMHYRPRNHFFSNVELIREETTETPNLFKSYDTKNYEITCTKLYYIRG